MGEIRTNLRDFYRNINRKGQSEYSSTINWRNSIGVADPEIEQTEESKGKFIDVFNTNENIFCIERRPNQGSERSSNGPDRPFKNLPID